MNQDQRNLNETSTGFLTKKNLPLKFARQQTQNMKVKESTHKLLKRSNLKEFQRHCVFDKKEHIDQIHRDNKLWLTVKKTVLRQQSGEQLIGLKNIIIRKSRIANL